VLFYWLDRLKYTKCVHPLSVAEITRHKDPAVVNAMTAKLKNYVELTTTAPDSAKIQKVRTRYDRGPNDLVDTALVQGRLVDEVFASLAERKRRWK
jgi:hypothetical protein